MLFLVNNTSFRGGNYSVLRFAEYLSRRGHHVFAVVSKYQKYFSRTHQFPKSFTIIKRPGIPFLFKGFGLLDRLFCRFYDSFVLGSIIIKNNIEYIIGMQTYDGIRASRLSYTHGIPLVNFIFTTPLWIREKFPELTDHPRFIKEWNYFRMALEKTDIIIANSEMTAGKVKEWLNRNNVFVVHPGIDQALADSIPTIEKENQILYIGSLGKNLDWIIKALSHLSKKPKFVICGEGKQKKHLQKLADQFNVPCDFKGTINNEEKWLEIKRSRALVFPTSFEGFGMPPAESLYCGVPCIASDIPVLREVYGDRLEYFVENDIIGLSKNIEKVINHSHLFEKKRLEGRDFIKNNFSWNKSAERIEQILMCNYRG